MCRTPRALVIHHLRPRPDGAATRALAEAGYELDQRHPIEGDPLPHPDEGHAVALVHGSLADVTRLEAPGIAEEGRWLEAWWRTGRPYFGICHGLQLAAQMLGAAVGPPAPSAWRAPPSIRTRSSASGQRATACSFMQSSA